MVTATSFHFSDFSGKAGVHNACLPQVPVKVVVATDLVVRGAHLLAFRTLKQRHARHRRKEAVLLPRLTTLSLLGVAGLLAFGLTFKIMKRR